MKLALRQTQRVVMTPLLQQAIQLLQLSTIELEQVVRQELEENPLLEEMPVEVTDAAATTTPGTTEEARYRFDACHRSLHRNGSPVATAGLSSVKFDPITDGETRSPHGVRGRLVKAGVCMTSTFSSS